MALRRGRSLTKMVTWGEIPGKMESSGSRVSPAEARPLSCPCPGQPFFLAQEGGLFSLVSRRTSSLNPRDWYLLGNSSLILFPSTPWWSGGCGSVWSWRVLWLALFLRPLFSDHKTSLIVPTLSSQQFLGLSYLCPSAWELHRDVYICLAEEPRK